MSRFSEVICERLGWCPDTSFAQPRVQDGPLADEPTFGPSLPVPAAPPGATATPAESRPVYRENILLIIVLVAGLFGLSDLKVFAAAVIFSALIVYYDAFSVHAGEKFATESFFGDVVAWRPATWAVCVLIIPLFFLAIYTFSRKDIFDANTSG